MHALDEKKQRKTSIVTHPSPRAGNHMSIRREDVSPDPKPELWRSSLDRGIIRFFLDAAKVALSRPAWWGAALRLFLAQRKATQRRVEWKQQGTSVPPFVILSVTDRCNLKCTGCYAKALHGEKKQTLSSDRLIELLNEAGTLGVSSVLLAGGEPLTRPDLLSVTRQFPSLAFALFTNGTLVDDAVVRELRNQRNVVPVLSIEGDKCATDTRRGDGVFSAIQNAMDLFRKNGIFFGCSVTVEQNNYASVVNRDFVSEMYRQGCRFFVFVEYVPVDETATARAVSQEQRSALIATVAAFRKEFGALFLAFPGDEDEFGGCLAAGRGFIHISAAGDLEPCPFAPYSDRSLASGSLKAALRSPLLEKIRNNHAGLKETAGGCALWAEREWVASLIEKKPEVMNNQSGR